MEEMLKSENFNVCNLRNLFNSGSFADLRFVCGKGRRRSGGGVISAHRSVLSRVSPVIRNLLDSPNANGSYINAREQSVAEIFLPDFETSTVRKFLSLIYFGSVEISSSVEAEKLDSLMNELKVSKTIPRPGDFDNAFDEDPNKELKKGPSVTIEPVIQPANDFEAKREIIEDEIDENCDIPDEDDDMDYDDMDISSLLQPETDLVVEEPTPQTFDQTSIPDAKKRRISENDNSSPPSAPAQKIFVRNINTMEQAVIPQEMFNMTESELEKKTYEILQDSSNKGLGLTQNEKCQCLNCMNPLKNLSGSGYSNQHVCHYPTCRKWYKKTSHLRAHLRSHVGEQPFACSFPVCTRRFTRSDELHRHNRIHTGEKNHVCPHCEKRFSRSDHLKKHINSHLRNTIV